MTRRQRKLLSEVSYNEQMSELYYTPKEAQKKLGMDRDRFNNLVKSHIIGRHSIAGTHRHFLKKEIDTLAERIEYTLMTTDYPSLEYRFALDSDLRAINEMAYMNFGDGARKPERITARRRFLEANSQSTVVLLDHEAIVASLDIVPLTHEAILEFREGKRGWQFPVEKIKQFEHGHRLEIIIIDMMTSTSVSMSQRQRYASTLLRKFGTETLVDWGKAGVDIKSIDACAGTALGKRILTSAGFTSLGIKLGTRDMYTLDIDQSDLHPLQPYKAALAEWKANH